MFRGENNLARVYRTRPLVPAKADPELELDARFRASLLSYFMRRTGNTQEAEDLTVGLIRIYVVSLFVVCFGGWGVVNIAAVYKSTGVFLN